VEAVVLAAGIGKRLRPITLSRPKVMIEIAGKPILEHNLEALKSIGVDRVVVVVGYKAADIIRYFSRKEEWKRIEFIVQEKQLGTGHALACAQEKLREDATIVYYGDVLADIQSLCKFADKASSGEAAIAVYEVERPWEYGVCIIRGGELAGIVEKPRPGEAPGKHVFAGIVVADKQIISKLRELKPSKRGEIELTDALIKAAYSTRIEAIKLDKWVDIGRAHNLIKSIEIIAENTEYKGFDRGRVAYVDSEADVKGEIGPLVSISEGAYVGEGSTIRRAVVLKYSSIGASCLIENTVIGERAHISANCKLIGREDSALIVGDESKLGSNTHIRV